MGKPIEKSMLVVRANVSIDDATKCWNWLGRFAHGTPMLGITPVRRIVFDKEIGPIPEGMKVTNTCESQKCVCPEHLFVGYPGYLNGFDKYQKERKEKTKCKRGHSFEDFSRIDKKGKRYCRACLNERQNRIRRGVAQ